LIKALEDKYQIPVTKICFEINEFARKRAEEETWKLLRLISSDN
jgi:hypothetical protein